MSKKPQRMPTARDSRKREALAAFIAHGSANKAAKATGIPRRTIDVWVASVEGQDILEELRATPASEDRTARIWRVCDMALDQLEEALRNHKIPPTALAVNIGILADKAARLAPKKADEQGDLEVHIRFGGVRVRDGDGASVEGQAAEVVVRKSHPGA